MGIVVIGDVFIDIKGFSTSPYIPYGRNAGTIAQIHGGVGRNVAEDIANVELEPTFVSSVDDDAMGEDVIRKLDRHKVNTKYMKKVKNGMGTWLAVFDHEGDVVASISKRPDHKPIEQILDEHGDREKRLYPKNRMFCMQSARGRNPVFRGLRGNECRRII